MGKRKPNGYWTKERCFEEAKKYKSRTEFNDAPNGAYDVARINNWLKDYTWFESKCKPKGYWNYETCYEEALKCNSRGDFKKINPTAYKVARTHDWLKDYTWFIEKVKPNGYWTYETCYEEAKKYKSLKEFRNAPNKAYEVARQHDWLKDYTWFENNQNKTE